MEKIEKVLSEKENALRLIHGHQWYFQPSSCLTFTEKFGEHDMKIWVTCDSNASHAYNMQV